jgi:hypothetical protein
MLLDALFLLLYFQVPLVAVGLYKLSGLSLSKPSIPYLFLIFYLILNYVGLAPMYFFWMPGWVKAGATDRNVIWFLYFLSASNLLLICAGFLYSSRVLRVPRRDSDDVYKPLKPLTFLFVILLAFICVFVTHLYVKTISGIPFMAAFSMGGAEAKLLRSEAANAYAGKLHYYLLFKDYLLPFCALVAFGQALATRRTLSWIFFGVIFLITTSCLVLVLEKAPIAKFFLAIIFFYILARRRQLRPPLLVITGICLLAVVFGLFKIALSANYSNDDILLALVQRLLGEILPAYFYVDLFPKVGDFLWGASLPNPGGIIPGHHQVHLQFEVMKHMWPHLAELGVVGSAPAVYWAEVYANFGTLLAISLAFPIGVLLYIVDAFLMSLKSSPLTTAAIVWLGFHFVKLCSSLLSAVIIDLKMWTVVIVIAGLLFIEKEGKIGLCKYRNIKYG